MINLMEKRYDAPKYVLWCVFMILVLSGMIVGYTKIYNVVSFTCFINGRWDDSNKYVGIHDRAQAGDVAAQKSWIWHHISGACVPSSAKRRKIGLQWLQKLTQNDPSVKNITWFYSYARLYVSEEPSFLPVANRLVMNAVDTEVTEDNPYPNYVARWNEILRFKKAIIECEHGEQEWQKCREIMRDATETEHYVGKWYYAEILARGLGGDADRDRAVELIDELIANEAKDLPNLGAVSSIEASLVHKKNLFLSDKGVDFNLSKERHRILSDGDYNEMIQECRQDQRPWWVCIFIESFGDSGG